MFSFLTVGGIVMYQHIILQALLHSRRAVVSQSLKRIEIIECFPDLGRKHDTLYDSIKQQSNYLLASSVWRPQLPEIIRWSVASVLEWNRFVVLVCLKLDPVTHVSRESKSVAS